jgi:hypothetical protein
MLTAVLLLLLPAVLGMSVMRVLQLPRDLWVGRAVINPRRKALCVLAFGALYCALAIYTILVLCAVVRAVWTPPRTIHDLLAAAFVAVAYPLVYLAFEWVLYYSVKPVPQA